MIERFEGPEGMRRRVEVLKNQKLVLQNPALAQALAEEVILRECERNEILYLEGDAGHTPLYFILTGSLDVLVKGNPVTVVPDGQAVGEFPLLDPSLAYTVTVRSRETSVVAEISETQFLGVAEKFPEIWKNMAKMLAARLRATDGRVPDPKPPCIFIGHGHSEDWKTVQDHLQNILKLKVVFYESEERAGKSVGAVLEQMLGQATFAVLVLTGEDETVEGKKRARQNVVHEAGLFQGRLGFERAIMLVQKNLEDFSNVAGLNTITFHQGQIQEIFAKLEGVLRREKCLEDDQKIQQEIEGGAIR